MSDKRRTFWDRCVKDADGKLALWQTPNLPLTIWLVTAILGDVIKHGNLHQLLHGGSVIALGIWAILELLRGTNYARRALGALVLIVTIIGNI